MGYSNTATGLDANTIVAAIQAAVAIQGLGEQPGLVINENIMNLFHNVFDEDFIENDEIEDEDYEIEDEELEDEDDVDVVEDQYDDTDPEIGLSQMQTEICLMNQAIETSGLELSEILPAIAWLTTHSGRLVPCLDCLSEGWKENENGEVDGTGRCVKHIDHDNQDYLPELEENVFPNYLEILGEA